MFLKTKLLKFYISILFLELLPLNVFAGVIFTSEDDRTNSPSFILDAGDISSDFIDLEFGTSNTAKLRFDVINDGFQINKDLDLGNKEIKNVRIQNLVSAPTCNASFTGKIYYNTIDSNSYICSNLVWVQINNQNSLTFSDTDNDTKIQVEESSDEDIIRFDTAGSERMKIENDGEVNIGGSVLRFNRGNMQCGNLSAGDYDVVLQWRGENTDNTRWNSSYGYLNLALW